MTTIVIDTKSEEAKKMVEYLKTTAYAKIIGDDLPNEETYNAIQQVEEGKTNEYSSASEMIAKLKKKSGVRIGTHSDLFK